MKKRNPIAVLLLPFVTFGIYSLYWFVKTKGEMNKLGNDIPTAWLIIIPFVNIWWTWKYCEGVEHVTGGKLNALLCLVLLLVVGPIGGAIIQDSFNNNVAAAPAESVLEAAPAPEAAAPADTADNFTAVPESTPPAEQAEGANSSSLEAPAEAPNQPVSEQTADSETENKDETAQPTTPAV